MTKQPQIIDIVKFVVKHRKGKVFRNWSIATIAEVFSKAFDEQKAAYTLDGEGNITGVALIEVYPVNTRLHIKAVLTLNTMALILLLNKCLALYGNRNFTVTATRHGREIIYNLPKLLKKICVLNPI